MIVAETMLFSVGGPERVTVLGLLRLREDASSQAVLALQVLVLRYDVHAVVQREVLLVLLQQLGDNIYLRYPLEL